MSCASGAEGIYGVAPRLWPGSTIVCIASGPSLTIGDAAMCAGGPARVIAVNGAVDAAPWADVLFAADRDWWLARSGMPGFGGLKVRATRLRAVNEAPEPALPFRDVLALRSRQTGGLDDDPRFLATGGNSGYLAVNLAVHLGARRIVLLGYDMQLGSAGERHFHGDHGSALRNPEAEDLARWVVHFWSLQAALLERGIIAVNCSRVSALNCFPRRRLEDEVASWR